LSELLCAQKLESRPPQGGNCGKGDPPHRFDPSLDLESSGKGGLVDLGLERGRARGGSVRELREVGELMRKRE